MHPPPPRVGRTEPAQIWGSWKMRRTKPISSSVPAKQKRGGKRICGGKGAGTLSWAWLYWFWVSEELLEGGKGCPDPLLGPDLQQQSSCSCRGGDGPCAKAVPVLVHTLFEK